MVESNRRLRFRNLRRIGKQEAGQKNGKAGRCGLCENPWSQLPLRELQNNVSYNHFIELNC
jgi:hypothetical protein